MLPSPVLSHASRPMAWNPWSVITSSIRSVAVSLGRRHSRTSAVTKKPAQAHPSTVYHTIRRRRSHRRRSRTVGRLGIDSRARAAPIRLCRLAPERRRSSAPHQRRSAGGPGAQLADCGRMRGGTRPVHRPEPDPSPPASHTRGSVARGGLTLGLSARGSRRHLDCRSVRGTPAPRASRSLAQSHSFPPAAPTITASMLAGSGSASGRSSSTSIDRKRSRSSRSRAYSVLLALQIPAEPLCLGLMPSGLALESLDTAEGGRRVCASATLALCG